MADIEEHWSLDDVMLAHEWLDAYDEAQRKADKKSRPKKR